jgi:hypothetical protein
MQAASSLLHQANVQQIITAIAATAQGQTRRDPPRVARVAVENAKLSQPENSVAPR